MAGQLVACHGAAVSAEPDNRNPGAMPDRRRSKRHGAMVRSDGATSPSTVKPTQRHSTSIERNQVPSG